MVASMVVFEDGLPRKSEYRRFAIRGPELAPCGVGQAGDPAGPTAVGGARGR